MKKYIFLLVIVLAAGVGAVYLATCDACRGGTRETATAPVSNQAVTVLAEGLSVPWDLAFLPDGDLLVTERDGRVLRVRHTGERSEVAEIEVEARGEGGLLGIALHPAFSENNYVYLYRTVRRGGRTENAVERYRFTGEGLVEQTPIFTRIPGAANHDGGRIDFGPDGMLYIATGDAGVEENAQHIDSLAGKILRVGDDGSIPADNPFGTAVYSYGHRNPQGLAWSADGELFVTEHGRSGIRSGFDELNRVVAGANYGWPVIEGDVVRKGMESPLLHSGANDTWAPASAAYHSGSIFFGGLRAETLYEAQLTEEGAVLVEHLAHQFGRIRTVRVGPDGMLYLTTSNRDGRGEPTEADDRIIRINPAALR